MVSLYPGLLGLGLVVLVSTGCSADDLTQTVSPSVCKSEIQWVGGDEESPLMHPGKDCIACHTQKKEGPSFAIAGTVFPDLHEADDCYGSADVEVVITGAKGETFSLKANAAGNFFLDKNEASSLSLPYTAKVISGGKEKVMKDPQVAGSCNACHTKDGASSAPGRITIP